MNSQPARQASEAPPQGGQGFQPPPGRQASEAPPQGGQGFQPPPGPYSIFRVREDARRRYVADPAGAAAASVSQVADVLADVPAPLRDARAHLEQQLSQAAAGPVATALAVDAFTGIGNVQGVAIGVSQGSFTETAPPGSPCLVVYLADPAPADEVQALVAQASGVSASAASADLPTRSEVVGIIEAQAHRFLARPAPAGISVGHVKITAGTISAFFTGRTAPRDSRMLMLSNNHVLANVNNAVFGDSIVQPGPIDSGTSPANQVAVLDRFVELDFTGTNYVDCATAWCWPNRVRREHVFLTGGVQSFFLMGSQSIAPAIDIPVMKSGRTTQVTTGRITGISATINVRYGDKMAHFEDAISITGNSGFFSQGGDSGSAILTNDDQRQPVGLLFAGAGGTTYACRIDRVMDALDIRFL